MPSSVLMFLLLTVVITAAVVADSDVKESATGVAAGRKFYRTGGSADRSSRATPAIVLRRARQNSGTTLRAQPTALVLVRPRGQARRLDVQESGELDGLVEKSRLFTADPEAASAGRLYRQLALYPSGPSAPSGAAVLEVEEEGDLDNTLSEEQYLLDNGDFGRRLSPQRQSTALPAYPPYSHGPLAVPIEPYRSPEYGPVSEQERPREKTNALGPGLPAGPSHKITVRPATQTTVQPGAGAAEEPLQGDGKEPPTVFPEQEVTVRQQKPAEEPARRPAPRRPQLSAAPALPLALTRTKSTKAPRRPLKAAVLPPHKPGSGYHPTRPFYSEQLNEVPSGPLQSPHGPLRQTAGPLRSPPARSEVGSGLLEARGLRERRPSAEYRHYSVQRQAKKLGGFKRARLNPHRYAHTPVDVSYGARSGNDGAFEWFSDYPVGSSHH